MSSPDVATRRPAQDPAPAAPAVALEQAEAAIVEHYPRLVRLGYLVLPPSLGRNRRVLTAHALAQRALPKGRTPGEAPAFPQQRTEGARGRLGDPGYAYVRLRVLRGALAAGLPLRRRAWPRRAQFPPLLPQVWGLRLFPRSGGADELALDQRLSALSGPARAAYVLRGLEGLPDTEVRRILDAAGVEDPHAALAEADGVEAMYALLDSPEFDPCSLQARPTDLMRRRQHTKAALVATAAVVVCGALLGLPGDGWGPDGAAAPSYAKNPAAEAALDPDQLTAAGADAWKRSARTDFSAWPARGSLTGDKDLLRRALAVWARPGRSVQVSATPGTPAGAPPGPAQLLYAGEVDQARVVVLYDGLRIARYAEPKEGTSGAALDFARVDGAGTATASALVVGRTDGNVRYLTAPWVSEVAVRDLTDPSARARALGRTEDGVTDPVASSAQARKCTSWNALELGDNATTRTVTDLGELTPAHLTSGRPEAPRELAGGAARRSWAQTACLLPTVRSHGVRSVNSWAYAHQTLPEDNGTATWVCTRAETWRGAGSRTLAQFQAPGKPTGAIAAKAEDAPACGPRDPKVLAGVLWKSQGGSWYLLAGGSRQIESIETSGGVRASADGNTLSVRAKEGARAELDGRLENGDKVSVLR
ncbi:hypothetical protein [Streptomyces indicus]|uniref:DNA-directed RNA polymerase specialized sigma subunit, sigma24 family n=1 Tax=Streptomyces indicus TaxID=417292 RepID=A0A1G8YN87_9ACTN|nr:hypothetical protein [Streptomyces indicus]SDK04233.1 hypothetical protein SAMN05421806_104165 [Streptomyces indicus]